MTTPDFPTSAGGATPPPPGAGQPASPPPGAVPMPQGWQTVQAPPAAAVPPPRPPMPPGAFPQGQPGHQQPQGYQQQGVPQHGVPPQGYPQQGYPQQGYPQPGYPPMGGPSAAPSRTTTVVITALFGLFGMIPAHLHGKRAEAVGVPASRYWKAFGITIGIVVAVHVLIWTLLFVFVFSVASTVAANVPAAPTTAADTGTRTPDAQQPTAEVPADSGASDLVWSAGLIEPVLAAYADEETEDWAAFGSDVVVTIPCGGEGANGISPATLETTSGGNLFGASAQILPDAAAAGTELQRLSGLVAGCGPHDYISASDGSVLTQCEAPIIGSLGPVIRYEQVCASDPAVAYGYAIFQTSNAVVAISAPSAGELDVILPVVLEALQAG